MRNLVTRTGVAGVTLLAAASLAVGGCTSSTPNASASNCSAKHAAGGAASPAAAAAWTLPNADMQNTRDVASAITSSDVARLGVA